MKASWRKPTAAESEAADLLLGKTLEDLPNVAVEIPNPLGPQSVEFFEGVSVLGVSFFLIAKTANATSSSVFRRRCPNRPHYAGKHVWPGCMPASGGILSVLQSYE